MILLTQTRQADRERAAALADGARHDVLARESLERQRLASDQAQQLRALLDSNTALTDETRRFAERLEGVAREIYLELRPDGDRPSEWVSGLDRG